MSCTWKDYPCDNPDIGNGFCHYHYGFLIGFREQAKLESGQLSRLNEENTALKQQLTDSVPQPLHEILQDLTTARRIIVHKQALINEQDGIIKTLRDKVWDYESALKWFSRKDHKKMRVRIKAREVLKEWSEKQ